MTNRDNNIASTLLIMHLTLGFFLKLYGIELLLYVWTFLGFLILLWVLKNRNNNIISIVSLLLCYIGLMSINSLFNTNIELTGIIFNVQYMGVTALLLNYRLNHKMINLLFYLIMGVFISFSMRSIDPNLVFVAGSRNLISMVVLNLYAIKVVIDSKNNKVNSLFPIILVVLVSFWSLSRVSFIVSLILLIGSLLIRIFNINSSKLRKK